MPVAEMCEQVTVIDSSNQISTNPEENLNVIKVDSAELKKLPVLGNDIISTMTNLLDAGSVGSDGPYHRWSGIT